MSQSVRLSTDDKYHKMQKTGEFVSYCTSHCVFTDWVKNSMSRSCDGVQKASMPLAALRNSSNSSGSKVLSVS